jgi:putative ABC transport system permease protein
VTGWSVMLRGIRHRSGRSVVVLLLAAFAAMSAVLAPAYGRAAQQSVLTDGLVAAPANATALTIGIEGGADTAPAAHQPVEETQSAVDAALARTPGLRSVLGRPVSSVEIDTVLRGKAGQSFAAALAWQVSLCKHVRVVGECAIDVDQVMLSQRSAQEAGIEVGDTVTVRPTRQQTPVKSLEVVGLYTAVDPADGFWGNNGYFAHGAQSVDAGAMRLDAVFAGAEENIALSTAAPISLRLAYPLVVDAVQLDDVATIRAELGSLGLALNASELQLETSLLSILDDVSRDQRALGQTIPIIAVPLMLLACFVLFMLVAVLTEDRGPELALARLRGFPNGRTVRFGLGETLLLIVVGTPLGLLAGLGLVELAARTVLATGTHVEPRWPVFAAAAGGLLVAATAAWLAGRRTVSRGVLGLLRRVPKRTTWRAGVLEGAALAAAIASLVAAAQDRSAPLALLAPAALAVVAGISAGRLLSAWARLRLRLARRRGNISTMLAAAQLARRAGATRSVAVLTAAVALLTFAAVAWDVAAAARTDRAQDAVGAHTVHVVSAPHPQALVEAVAQADPSGHSMAVVRADEQYDGGRIELIGVQSKLLSTVAQWRGQDRADLAALSDRLRGVGADRKASDIAAVSGSVTVRLAVTSLGAAPIRLSALISAPGEPPAAVGLGQLRAGNNDYSGTLAGCNDGCRLVGLAFGRQTSQPGELSAVLQVTGVSSGSTAVPVRLTEESAWRVVTEATPNARVQLSFADNALRISLASTDQGDVRVSYLDVPAELPAVAAGSMPAAAAGAFTLPAFADVPQRFAVFEQASLLPRVGAHGLLFDLDLAVRSASVDAGLSDATDLRYEVWAGSDAPPGMASQLAAAGVQVLYTETVTGQLDQLGRRAPALGLRLYLLAGVAAALLALGVLGLSLHLAIVGRRDELAALLIAGVRARQLRRSLRAERGWSLILPLLVGIGAGLGGAVLMLPGIALVTVGVTGLSGDLWSLLIPQPGLHALPIALAGALVVLLVTVARAGRVVRRSAPELIRGGSQ